MTRAAQARALVKKGRALFAAGRYQDAAQVLEEAIALDQRNAAAHAALGAAYAKLRRVAAAAAEYEIFLELAPDHPQASQVRRYIEEYRARQGK